MDIELPASITAETLNAAKAAGEALRDAMDRLPPEIGRAPVRALLDVLDAVTAAAGQETGDLSPSQVAERLRTSRPTVMRLIARGDLLARRTGGRYVIAPRELRGYRTRIEAVRRDAMAELARMARDFNF